MGVDVDHEAEVARQVAADLGPRLARIVGAHDVPVLLHEEHLRPRAVHRDVVDAVPHFGLRIRYPFGSQPLVDRLPRLAAVVGAKRPGRGDGDVNPGRVARIDDDRVEAQTARARRPVRSGTVAAQARQLGPGLGAVGRVEERGILDAGINRIGIGQRRFEVPDALELPGVRRPVVPLMRARNAVVGEVVPRRLPGFAAVVRALDNLAEPARRLRGVETVRIGRRSLEVIDLPASEVGTGDVPLLSLAVRRQDERTLARADEYPYPAHLQNPFDRAYPPYPVVDRRGQNSTDRERLPRKFSSCTFSLSSPRVDLTVRRARSTSGPGRGKYEGNFTTEDTGRQRLLEQPAAGVDQPIPNQLC